MFENVTEVSHTNQFKKSYKKLPENIQKKFKDFHKDMMNGIVRPSFNIEKLGGSENKHSARLSYHYRVIFSFEKNRLRYLTIGNHDIY